MNEKLKEAFTQRKNQNFQQAVEIYQPVWNENPNMFDEWDGWSYAFSLSKLNLHSHALNICRVLFPRFKTSEILNSLYAKCIYYTEFVNQKDHQIDVWRKAVKAMLQLSPPHAPYSFTAKAIFRLTRALMQQQEINWVEIESWLLKMEPDLLDDAPFKMTDKRGKQIELASLREVWYSSMIRAKGGMNKPGELLEILTIARKQNIKWHYNNDIWLARKEAFALKELNRAGEAEAILRRIVQQKKDWFLLYDLACIVRDRNEVLQLMARAALAPGKDEHKLKLFDSLNKTLSKEEKYNRESALHICLIIAIREENNWSVKDELIQEATAKGVNPKDQGSSSAIKKQLHLFWEELTGTKKGSLTGRVEVIFPNNKAGFIVSEGRKYYFTLGRLSGKLLQGSMVTFELEDSFDRKKNKPSKIAINLKLI